MSAGVPAAITIRRIPDELTLCDDDVATIMFGSGGVEVIDLATGRTTGQLTWGEIMEQVACLFPISTPSGAAQPFVRYPMKTLEEWRQEREERERATKRDRLARAKAAVAAAAEEPKPAPPPKEPKKARRRPAKKKRAAKR